MTESASKNPAPSTMETGSKEAANRYQTGSSDLTKRVANRYQTGSKQVAEHPTSDTLSESVKPKRVAERVAEQVANGEQTGSKRVAKPDFRGLVGRERLLLLLIFSECRATGELVSPPMTLERIAGVLEIRSNRAKNVINRLLEKGVMERAESKTGRGGWTKFRLPREVFQNLLLSETGSKEVSNGYQTGSKQVAKRVAERVADAPSSSSFLELENLKTTTTEPELKKSDISPLGQDWVDLDYSSLTEIGFTQNHLSQIAKQGNLSATEVQDSIHFFAFDLKRNEKAKEIKGAPINFFMGILRKGIPYAAPENYESPESEARRKYLESKRRLEAEREAQERELQDLEFTEWRRGLSPAELSAIVPEVVRHAPRACESALRTHFDENVWPTRKATLPGKIDPERAEIVRQIEGSLGLQSKQEVGL